MASQSQRTTPREKHGKGGRGEGFVREGARWRGEGAFARNKRQPSLRGPFQEPFALVNMQGLPSRQKRHPSD